MAKSLKLNLVKSKRSDLVKAKKLDFVTALISRTDFHISKAKKTFIYLQKILAEAQILRYFHLV